eukprot:CCRYP_020636-RB/>CCRYP_020636-RB protein AED:0.48 eAED:1.00 QI:0/0/0/1/0/0/2/0/175
MFVARKSVGEEIRVSSISARGEKGSRIAPNAQNFDQQSTMSTHNALLVNDGGIHIKTNRIRLGQHLHGITDVVPLKFHSLVLEAVPSEPVILGGDSDKDAVDVACGLRNDDEGGTKQGDDDEENDAIGGRAAAANVGRVRRKEIWRRMRCEGIIVGEGCFGYVVVMTSGDSDLVS